MAPHGTFELIEAGFCFLQIAVYKRLIVVCCVACDLAFNLRFDVVVCDDKGLTG